MNTTTRAKDVVVGDEMLIRVKQGGERKRVSAVVSDIIGKGKEAVFTFTDESISPRLYRRRKRVVITGRWFETDLAQIRMNELLDIDADTDRNSDLDDFEAELSREVYEQSSREEVVGMAAQRGMHTTTKTTKKAAIEFLVGLRK